MLVTLFVLVYLIMNKIIKIIILSILLSSTSFAGVKKGKGEVTMTANSVDWFIQYIRGKKSQVPLAFILSSDGSWSTYWFCPMMKTCQAGNYMPTIRICEEKTGVDCGLFARKKTILWKNGINPGKGKASRISSKWSDAEIRAKLTELGFLGGSSSTSTTTTPKITKKKETKKIIKKKSQSTDIVSQLKDLKDLLDSGVLTNEEFENAKKKLLD